VSVGARNLSQSAQLLERARGLIPAWTQTLSKNPTQWVRGVAPAYVRRAEGAYVWDVDGNRYTDYPMGLGPVILGHAHPAVNEAIAAQLADGITYTLPHPIELDVAERIAARVPGAERVRFGKTGSDVNTAAVRLARAVTGRDGILACGYHGWHDWYVATTSRSAGVPDAVAGLTDTFAYNDLASLDEALARQDGGTALVILEPSGADLPAPGFLEGVVERAHAAGALVCFDEIITGFRLARGGAQERYGVRADVATFGKALGNGMPISAIAGRAEHMDVLEDVFFSGTHGGEVLSLAAARATLDELEGPGVYETLFGRGERLRAGIQAAIDSSGTGEVVTIGGEAPRTVVQIDEPQPSDAGLLAKSVVQQELIKRGVLFNGSNFICLAHSDEDIDTTAAAWGAALGRLADGLGGRLEDLLEGEPLQNAFRPV
jgi:glutamate-1-semialdehyde aminotransferase